MSLCCILWIGSFWISVWNYSQVFLVTTSFFILMVAIMVKIFQNNRLVLVDCLEDILTPSQHPDRTCMLDNISLVYTEILYFSFWPFNTQIWFVRVWKKPGISIHKVLLLTHSCSCSPLFSPRCLKYIQYVFKYDFIQRFLAAQLLMQRSVHGKFPEAHFYIHITLFILGIELFL